MYKIIQAYTKEGIEKDVNAALAEWYKPCGGLAIYWMFYCQSVWKETI